MSLAFWLGVRASNHAYDRIVQTKDITPLEPDLLEHKYAPGVGPVLTVDVANAGRRDELVRFTG